MQATEGSSLPRPCLVKGQAVGNVVVKPGLAPQIQLHQVGHLGVAPDEFGWVRMGVCSEG